MTWAVPRGEHHLDVQAGQLEALAPLERMIGLVALEVEVGEHHRARLTQPIQLRIRAVDGGAGGLCDLRDGTDVIPVRVGQQDRLQADAEVVYLLENRLRLATR